jgi:hypothetical protein
MEIFHAAILVVMALIGITLIVWGAYKLITKRAEKKPLYAIAAGILLIFGEQVTHVKFLNVELTKTTATATANGQMIKQIKERVEGQRDTIDEAFTKAKAALKVSEQASNKVAELNSVLVDAKTAITNINEQLELSSLIVRAENYDRQAFFKLRDDHTKPEEVAILKKVLNSISQSVHERCGFLQTLYSPTWDIIGVNPDKESYEELLGYCKRDSYGPDVKSTSDTRFHILRNVFGNKRFTESQRFAFVAECLRTDNHLLVVEEACELLDTRRNSHRNFMDLDGYLQWYEEHKSEFKTTL